MPDGRSTAPDQDGGVCVFGCCGGAGPGEGKAEVGGDGVEDCDEVVGERYCCLRGDIGWDLVFPIVNTRMVRGKGKIRWSEGGATFPRRYSGTVANSWCAFSFCSLHANPNT